MGAIKKNYCPLLACTAAIAAISGCAAPVTEISPVSRIASGFDTGRSYTRTVGEIVVDRYEGAWLLRLTNPVAIEILGEEPVPAGSDLLPRYTDDASGKLIVVSEAYDPDIGIICGTDSEGFVADSAIQVDGGQPGRRWQLASPIPLIKNGFVMDDQFTGSQEGWRLQYVGKQGSTLRFTVDELGMNRQRMGQVEYTYDIDSGTEFVYRGARIQIDRVDSDSTLHYTILRGTKSPTDAE